MAALSHVPRAPKFSFGARLSVGEEVAGPGPGSYLECLPEKLAKHGRIPKYTFGSGSRAEPKRQQIPGPGTYTPRRGVGEGPVFSLLPRRDQGSPREKHPGPGSHNLPELLSKTSPRITMLPRREDSTERRTLPGPGDYGPRDHLASTAAPGWGFGSASQRPKEVADGVRPTPGPGSYRHDAQSGGPRFSMRSRTANEKARVARF
mmetsp:Transcript_33448/g.73183  ORF Transcript_33448/g.73183 Transcript_33448/m.73183 type:complete len:205 (+) Transcript_33448:44-658(+)